LKRTLAEGTLGEVYFTRVWCGHVMNIPGWGHFHRRRLAGGGVVMATTVHALDFALWVLGNPAPAQVSAFTYSRLRQRTAPAFTENPAPVRSFLQEAISCAREGGEPVVRPEEIVQVQAVMDAIYRSAELGGPVVLEG